jgi:hypothetical protein
MGKANPAKGDQLFTTVDDETYAELEQLAGEKVVHAEVWEDSLSDALEERGAPPSDPAFDIDLYLEGGVYFELYGVTCYADLDGTPFTDRDAVARALLKLVKQGATLGEVAVDEEDALVLVLALGDLPLLYLVVGGWLLEEWDELPL